MNAHADVYGPRTELGDRIHAMKYRGPGEIFREAMNRIAGALTHGPEEFRAFREILLDMRFMPAGRIQTAVGSTRQVTPYNCYVSGTIMDSFVHGEGNIMQRATEAAATMRMGGGIGYDFSTLRPRGDLIAKLQSHSTGPISFMEIFDAICRCVASSGHRRGAQMGVLRVDHPDIEEFIHAKQNEGKLTGFNISIGVTDEFMGAVEAGRDFELKFGGKTYSVVDARALWELIMRSTWDWAEPGVLFIDQINRYNNLWYCETIAATNPCGEQPLPPFGACLLGSFNLTRYMRPKTVSLVGQPRWEFDWGMFRRDVVYAVRALDTVIDIARYPLPQQEREAKSKRRMGLGITGLANTAEALGYPYGSEGFCAFEDEVLTALRDESYRASAILAGERGAFPLYSEEHYLKGLFIKQLPDDIQALIRKNGIRNSHLTSIAPTGTISLAADNVSSGIEPVFSYSTQRTFNTPEGAVTAVAEDYGVREFGVRGKEAAQVRALEHVLVAATAQRRVDSSVSKTCNVDGTMPWEDFKDLYMSAWRAGSKGLTTFNADGKRMALLKAVVKEADEREAEPAQQCYFDPDTGRRECS